MKQALDTRKRNLIIFISVIAIIALITVFAFTSNNKKPAEKTVDAAIELAFTELNEVWTKIYDDVDDLVKNGSFKTTQKEDRILDIRGVRVIKINPNGTSEFADAAYLVEFELYSNRYRTAPYYTQENIYDSVIIYKDNQTQIRFKNDLEGFADRFDNESVIGLIGEEYYFTEEYNRKIQLK